ncbi:MAG TPA: CBS domain-containing protein [Candidatus Binatia bacterium]|jgi:acetoin utilization protein AcuB|nr:CBS domain-containing protein [Candidatus Binatia bacterium]
MAAKKIISKAIRVVDWMSEGVLAVETFDSIAVARRLMAKHRVNQLPVLDNDRLVGIVTDRDVRDAYPTSLMINRAEEIDRFADKITVEEVMTHDVFVVRPDTALATAVGLLRRHRIGALPVIKDQKLVGIITRSDILDFVLRNGLGQKRKRAKSPASGEKPSRRKRRRASAKAS